MRTTPYIVGGVWPYACIACMIFRKWHNLYCRQHRMAGMTYRVDEFLIHDSFLIYDKGIGSHEYRNGLAKLITINNHCQ